MNCGSDDAMGVYVGAVSAMAVEMNANQTNSYFREWLY